MTARERIFAAIEGREVDRKPTISWPRKDTNADIQVYPAGAMAERSGQFPTPTLAHVWNLYRQFEMMGEDPVTLMKNADSSDLIEAAEEENRRAARLALENGALGVLYEVHGADASQCTPMEYGGLFLERDRAFLESIAAAPCNFIYINGKEPYLDFVSDLPAEVFAWDTKGSQIPLSEVKKMRAGAFAADDPGAEVPLPVGESITDRLKGALANV